MPICLQTTVCFDFPTDDLVTDHAHSSPRNQQHQAKQLQETELNAFARQLHLFFGEALLVGV